MALSQWPFLAAVLLLVSQGLQCSPALPSCPVPCLCHKGLLLNCSSSGLSTAPGHIQATVTELDLSHNLLNSLTLRWPNQNLRNLWLGNNSITHLSLCMERTMTSQDAKRAGPRLSRPWSRQRCLSWAPALQLLSVERNQLVQLPEGLGGSESLQVLQLSYNRISTLRPGDLSSLLQLRELHLQHNHLTNLHLQAFRDLAQLRVLDLSFNLLTTLPPLTYLSLRNLEADVDLHGNRWQCDCSMRSVRRWMFYDRDRGQPAWRVVCASPSALSGRDLLQLEEGDLTCSTADKGPGLHQDVTVDEGSEILLPCSSTHKDSTWWTPNGQVSVSRSEAGLLIRDITERDTGLYVCMSESQQELVSVFNLLIRKTGETQRKTRSPGSSPQGSQLVIPLQGTLDRVAKVRNKTTTQSDLALAVSLSVIFTFLVAFILGVLARPFIDILWRRICIKKTSTATYSVSSAEQRPYDNEGYSDGEEPEEIGAHRERRVTFTMVDFRDNSQASNGNVPYYDTVASVNQESNHEGAVKGSGATYVNVQEGCSSLSSSEAEPEKKKPKAGDSDSDSSSQHDSPEEHQKGQKDLPDVTHPGPTHSMEFEHIPDPDDLGERRSSSSHSETSHSDQERNEEQMTQKNLLKPQFTQKVEDSSQQRSHSPTVRPVEVPHISINGRSEIPGFTSEPFADWPPNTNDSEIWNDSGDSFEFSDSFRGASPRSSSVLGSLDHSKQNAFPPSDNRKRPDSSSSSSTLSSDEQTHYTVNPEREEDGDIEASLNTQFAHDTKPEIINPYLTRGVSFEQEIHSEDPFMPSIREEGFNQGDSRQETQIPPMGPGHSHSSSSSDSDDEPTEYTVNEDSNEEKEKEKVSKSDKSVSIMVTVERDRAEEISPAPWTDIEPKAKRPDLTLGVPSIKKKQKAPLPPVTVSSSSSSENDAETTDHTVKQNWNEAKVGITSQEPETKWLDLSLDIKAQSPNTSSSSESEDETADKSVKQDRGEVDMSGITLKELQITSQRTETRWPGQDLSSVPSIKRHLDLKAPSPPPKSSPSSSEDETTDRKVKRGGEEANVPEITYKESYLSPVAKPMNVSLTLKSAAKKNSDNSAEVEERSRIDYSFPTTEEKPNLGSMWVGMGVPGIRRRLDIKIPEEAPPAVPSPRPPTSSSSSESEDDSTGRTGKGLRERAEELDFPMTEAKPHPGSMWTSLGVPRIRRRVDIKIPEEAPPAVPSPRPPTSSSSSESEDNTTGRTGKGLRERAEELDFPMTEAKPHPGSMWTSLGVPRIRRRLDIKIPEEAPPAVPSPRPPTSSSSSESEDDSTGRTGKGLRERAEELDFPMTEAKPHPGSMWTGLGVPRIRRRLDIKIPEEAPPAVPSPRPPTSSSSSESEDDTTGRKGKGLRERAEELDFPMTEAKPHPGSMWTSLGVPRIRRRVDIKIPEEAPPAVPSPRPPTSSSSSESEDNTTGRTGKGLRERAEELDFPMTEAKPHPGSMWTSLGVPRIRRRLDIKIPEEAPPAVPSPRPPTSSSSSESEDNTTGRTGKGLRERAEELDFPMTEAKPHPGSMWTSLGVPRIRRRLDIKIPEEAPPAVPSPRPPTSSSSSESEDNTTGRTGKGLRERAEELDFPMTEAKPHPGSMWTGLGVPRIRRCLDIKIQEEAPPAVPTPRPPDSSSSSESEDDTSGCTGKGLRERPEVPVVMHKESPQSPNSLYLKRVVNINFDRSESSPTPRVEREPASKWPDLGLSRVPHNKKRLDIKAPSPSQSKSSSSESEGETTGQTVKQEKDRTEVGIASQEPEIKWPDLDLQNIPHIKRHLDIKASSPPPPLLPRGADSPSSSSNSEDETKDHTVKQGKRESENVIVKGKDPPFSVGGINVSLAPRRALNIGFDDVVRRRIEQNKRTPDVDLAPELKWKGIGRYSQSAISTSEESRAVESALNTSSLRRQVDVDIKPTKEAAPKVPGGPPPAPSSSSSSYSSESEDEIEQDREKKAKITLSHNYSLVSPVSVSLAPRRALDIKFDNSSTSTDVTDWGARSEDKGERRGLIALKAMSSERQKWDTAQEELQRGSYSVRQDQSISYQTSERDLKSFAKLSAPESPLSSVSTETQAVRSPHRISRLRRRAVVAFQPPQETPPPVPGTAPVEEEEAAGSTWRSPLSSVKQDWSSMGSYKQREMSVDGYVHSSMSSVSRRDEGQISPSLIGLMGATPYHPHTAPKRYQSVTSSTSTHILRIDREESDTSSTISKNSSLFDYTNSITDV